MSGHKHLTEKEAQRIWLLHKKGLKTSDIMFAVDRDRNSVLRVVDVFKKAEAGDWESVAKYYSRNQNITRYARAMFAPTEEPAPQPAAPAANDNTAKYLCEVLTELRRNNALLEKLLAVWEVQA